MAFFWLRVGSYVLGKDVPWLCGLFLGDACGQDLILILATWHINLHQLIGYRIMVPGYMKIGVGIGPGNFR